MSMNKLSVLIPTYNERENLPMLLKSITTSLNGIGDYELVIIDDNSPDGTGYLADDLAKFYKNLKVLHRPEKRGLASAVLDGLKVAEGEFIGVMDADMQHPPEFLIDMYKEGLKGVDLIIASRYCNGGKIEGWNLSRRLVSKVATSLAHILLPKTRKIKDPLSGYFLVRRKVLENANFNPLGYKLLIEIIVKGNYNRVIEVPYVFKPRMKGMSKLKLTEYINYLAYLLRLVVF